MSSPQTIEKQKGNQTIDDDDCGPDEGKKGGTLVFVDTFTIQKNEVSVAEYRACVIKTKCIIPYTCQRNKYCNYDAPVVTNIQSTALELATRLTIPTAI